MVKEFGGKLAVKLADGENGLSVKELAELGVCRVSMGAGLYSNDMHALRIKAERVLRGGQLWNQGN